MIPPPWREVEWVVVSLRSGGGGILNDTAKMYHLKSGISIIGVVSSCEGAATSATMCHPTQTQGPPTTRPPPLRAIETTPTLREAGGGGGEAGAGGEAGPIRRKGSSEA
mmetsp:Transcript_39913/g.64951  ORF Transcript_39913/g.64951 Transcript_39913/m.64951 type:complete len:109 (+) Transcript_39913:108-434(+)